MSNKQKTIVGLVILLVIVFVIVLIRSKGAATVNETPNDTTSVVEYADVVTVRHQYKNGVHTYAGDFRLPTPCHTLQSAIAAGSGRMVNFLTFTSTYPSDTMCAQVITTKGFKLSVENNPEAKVEATFNGKPLRLNIIEVGPNENLDDFEVNYKG